MQGSLLRFMQVGMLAMLFWSVVSPAAAQSSASDLRAVFAHQLGEHVILLAETTEAAITGTTASYRAAFAELDENSLALSETIGSIYGDDAVDEFLPLWRDQVVAILDYGTAAVANDAGAKEAATAEIERVQGELAAFFASVNPQVTEEEIVTLFEPYRTSVTALTEAQAANEPQEAHRLAQEAHRYTADEIARGLATAIDKQFPDTYVGTVQSPAAMLHGEFTVLLGEQVLILENSTDEILAGLGSESDDQPEALQSNTDALAELFGAAYGDEAAATFTELWGTFNDSVLAYTRAAGDEDQKARESQATALDDFVTEFGEFLAEVNPDGDAAATTELLQTEVDEMVQMIDAQIAGESAMLYNHLFEAYRTAAGSLAMELSGSIIQQFPESYPNNDPESLPTTGSIGLFSLLLIAVGLGFRVMSRVLGQRINEQDTLGSVAQG